MHNSSFIESSPDVLGGTPVFVGTRVPVALLAYSLQAGKTLGEFLADFPSVTLEQALGVWEESTIPFVVRQKNYPATLVHFEQEICLLLKGWEGEQEVLSRKLQLAGSWYFAEIDGELKLSSKERWYAEAREFWHKSRQHKKGYAQVWEEEGWSLRFSGGIVFRIYPPKFESSILLRWFRPCRQL